MKKRNPVRQKEYDRAYYIKNKQKIISRVLNWREKNREKWNETRRKYSIKKIESDPQYREKLKIFARNQYRKHRAKKLLYSALQKGTQKRIARTKLRHAIMRGDIIRSPKCDACNSFIKTEAHHDDYSKPLSVIWLCKICHEKVHRK